MAASSAWVVPPFLRISDSSRECRIYSLERLLGSDARTSSSQKNVVSPRSFIRAVYLCRM